MPAQSAQTTPPEACASWTRLLDGALLDELWQLSEADACGLERDDLCEMLAGEIVHLAATDAVPNRRALAEHFRNLRLADLTLAQACAEGYDRAWERFLALYRQPLTRAAIAITGSDSLGRELADQLYGELFGMTERDGQRRCPLASYRGRGSLLGWLRTTLAQRHVDHHRRTYREEPLVDGEHALDPPAAEPVPVPPQAELDTLRTAVDQSLAELDGEDRFLLASYYLDGRKLHQIGAVLGAHEATISRRLRRAAESVRQQTLKNLEAAGMNRRAAEDALRTDPRDLDVNLKTLLQALQSDPFQGEAAG